MTDIKTTAMLPPLPKQVRWKFLRALLIGLTVFGYGPAFTYGWLTWLLNEHQWMWIYLMYFTLVPLVGGFCVLVLPFLWYRPIDRALAAWHRGETVERQQCLAVYERALQLPRRAAIGAFSAALIGYLLGTFVVHWRAHQPFIEMIPKTLPAIPLVGGMMGAFCYFGTLRALQPVLAWCSVQLRHARPLRHGSIGTKFFVTTCVLVLASLCLFQPAAYRLGQVIVEEQLMDRSLEQLQTAIYRQETFARSQDKIAVLQRAALGPHGYTFAIDASGSIVTPHPKGYTTLRQERLYQIETRLRKPAGSWVDRVGEHRVISFVRLSDPAWTVFSVSLPEDFSAPLRHFVLFAWLAMLEILFVVTVFGRYFTRSITTPLGELTEAARRIADQGDLSQHVAVTTDDELGDLARAFNRMVEELESSHTHLAEYTRKLERSTEELSALNQEMEDVLRVVSHDLRAPLINIQGFSKRLEPIMQRTLQTLDHVAQQSAANGVRSQVDALRTDVEARFTESMRFISKGVEKMDALLSSLLAVSRVGRKADPIQPNNLDAIVDDVLAIFDHQLKEQAIRVIRHPLPTAVPCRRNEINQVFSNIFSNAIKYMGPVDKRFIEIGGSERDHEVECYVKDTGIGIAPEDQERIFQMFTRLEAVNTPGEGIGLAYVKKILRSHGGKMWVESARGQGSTFFFTLLRG